MTRQNPLETIATTLRAAPQAPQLMEAPLPEGYIPPQAVVSTQAAPGIPVQAAPAPAPVQAAPVQVQPVYTAPAGYASAEPIVPEPAQMVPVEVPATTQEIRQACPNAPAEFILQMFEQNATVAQCQQAYITHLQAQPKPVASAPQYVPQQAVTAAAPIQPMPGNLPVATADPSSGQDTQGQWNQLVANERDLLIRAGMSIVAAQRSAAININRQYPGLREQAFGL